MKSFWSRFTPCILLTLISTHFIAAQPPDRPTASWIVKPGNPILIEQTGQQTSSMSSVAFSPDGSLLATGGAAWENNGSSRKGVILLWDAHTGTARGELKGHGDLVQKMIFSPDSKRLATQSQDGALFIWDVATNRLQYRGTPPIARTD